MARDNDGNPVLPVVHSSFVLEGAVNQFKFFVSDDANLLDAKLVNSLFFVIYFSWFVAFLFIVIFGTVVLVVRVERTFYFIFFMRTDYDAAIQGWSLFLIHDEPASPDP